MTKLKNLFIRNRKLLSVFFSVAFSVLVVSVLVHGATTIGLNIDTGRNINASGTLGVDATSTLYGVGADLIVQGVSTSTFAGQLAVSGDFEVGSANASSTLQSDRLSVHVDSSNDLGIFYVDSSGNVSASGTFYGGGNSLADIGAFGNAWKNVYASGTIHTNSLSVGSDGTTSSTLSNNMLSVGASSANTDGVFYVDSSGNVSASGTLHGGGNNLADIGSFGNAWKNVYASGTIHGDSLSVGSGGLASSTLAGSGTSTFRSDLTLDTSNGGLIAATTTLQVGGYTTTTNRGGCIALTAASGTNSGLGTLYLIVQTNSFADTLMFTTSTNASDCY